MAETVSTTGRPWVDTDESTIGVDGSKVYVQQVFTNPDGSTEIHRRRLGWRVAVQEAKTMRTMARLARRAEKRGE